MPMIPAIKPKTVAALRMIISYFSNPRAALVAGVQP
jgi:hypothetical protein